MLTFGDFLTLTTNKNWAVWNAFAASFRVYLPCLGSSIRCLLIQVVFPNFGTQSLVFGVILLRNPQMSPQICDFNQNWAVWNASVATYWFYLPRLGALAFWQHRMLCMLSAYLCNLIMCIMTWYHMTLIEPWLNMNSRQKQARNLACISRFSLSLSTIYSFVTLTEFLPVVSCIIPKSVCVCRVCVWWSLLSS